MNRRSFISVSAAIATVSFAGCISSDQNDGQPSDGDPGSQQSTDEEGPVGPEEAVKHYDNAIELLSKNTEEFDFARQQLLLENENVNFSASTIASRTDEVRRQLDRAALEDDGSLEDEIETLRRVASYQDSLAQYNQEYLNLIRYLNSGLDYYSEGQYQQGILTLQNAQQQVGTTKSSLDDVEEKLNAVLDAADSADMGDRFREGVLLVDDDHVEVREELHLLDQVIHARIDEIRGEQAFESATEQFEAERFGSARSQYSDAERYFVSAITQIEHLNIESDTAYLASLINDANALKCMYEFLADASNEMAQASQAMQNDNLKQAESHHESANNHLSMIGTC